MYIYTECMFVANYMMQTETKYYTVYIPNILSDLLNNQSEEMFS